MALGGYDGSIRIKAELDSTNFNTGLSKMGNALKSFGKLVIAAFATQAVTNFVKDAINAASDLENAWMGLQSIVEGQGRSFGAAQSFINDYISDGLVPLENAVTSYKNLAARGYNDEQIQKVMTALKDAAAFGRQSSYTLGEAVTTATEGLKNENSILVDNAGVTKNVAKMWEDYATSIGTTSNKLTQQQKIEAEVAGIMAETKFQTGDAAKVAGTYSGQVAMLSYNFQNLKVSIGQGFMPIAQAILPGINTIISALAKLASVFAQVMKLLFGKSVSTSGGSSLAKTNQDIAATGGAAADSTDKLASSTGKAGKAAKQTAKEMKGVLASFDELNILADNSDSGSSGSGSGSGSGAGGVAGADIPGLSGGGEMFEDVTVNPEIEKFVEDLKKAIEPTIEALGRLWDQLQIVGGFAWEGLKDFYNSFLVPVGKWVLGEGLPRFIDAITNGLAAINWQQINDSLHNLWDALAPFAIHVGEGLLWLWENVLVPMGVWTMNEALPHFLDTLSAGLKAVDFSNMADAANNLLDALAPFAENIGEGLLWFWDNVLVPIGVWTLNEAVPTFLSLLAGAIKLLNAVLEKLKGPAQWLFDNFLVPIASWTAGTILDTLDELSDLLSDLADLLNGDISFSDFLSQLTPVQTALLALGGAATVAAVGLGLLSAGKAISSAITTIQGLFTTISVTTTGFRSFHDMITTVFGPGSIIAGIAAVIGGIILAVTNFVSMFTNGFSAVNEILMLVGIALTAVGAIILGAPAVVAGVVAGIVAAVATIVVLVKEHWDAIKQGFEDAWNAICDVWDQACDWFNDNVIEPIAEFFSGLADDIEKIWNDVVDWIDTNVIQPVSKFFSDLWDDIKNVWNEVTGWFQENIIDPLVNFFSACADTIGDVLEGCWIIIQACWKAVSDWFNTNVIEPVQKAFTDVTEAIHKFFSDAWDKIKEVWNTVSTWFTTNIIDPVRKAFDDVCAAIHKFFDDAWTNIKGVWDAVTGWFDLNIIQPITKAFTDVTDSVKRFFSDAWDNVKEAWNNAGTWFDTNVAQPIKNAFQGVKDFVRGILNGLISNVETLINGVINAINSLLGGFSNIVSKAADFIGIDWGGVSKIPTVHLPRLAQGAVIPPNKQFTAILGDQRSGTNIEAPLATIQEAVRSVMSEYGSNQPINVTVTCTLDGKVVARNTIQHINNMTRASGKSMLLL